jgi:hypothetical protein
MVDGLLALWWSVVDSGKWTGRFKIYKIEIDCDSVTADKINILVNS